MGVMLRNLRGFNQHLRELIEAARRRKKEGEDKKKEDQKDEERNVLTGLLPFVPVAVEGVFSGTEGSIGVEDNHARLPGRAGNANILQVIIGKIAPAAFVAAVGPIAAGLAARDALKNAAALSKRTGIPEGVIRNRIVAVENAARANGARF